MKFKILYLKSFIIGIIIFTLIISIFVIPSLIKEGIAFYSKNIIISFFVGIYLSIIPFLYSNIQVIKIINNISKNILFSEDTIKSLNKIKKSSFVFCVIYIFLFPIFYYLGEIDDAPGMILLGFIIILSSIFIYILMSVLIDELKNKL
ncbi:DUF2975 domain-containing protein [Marinitoga litoralis]|uniref:DUF2975 domain-containing protein n=1 Tax=Marinitoga litoralis TaxID=570855 RepID=UPI0019607DED|nr:DUF2975 domain-containing protein [Marinitoga litoralis]MBM7558411.1 phosphoglycerol transferase MdoB-like AlkP superfamily enzyme [Marinitoga litoralis]